MARDRADTLTLDLLDWQPPEIAAAFPEEKVRAATLRGRMAKAVSVSLRECGLERAEVARRMGAYLGGEQVSENMLDNYASEARADTTISVPRLLALVHVTGDLRLLQVLADPFGQVVVDKRYVSIIRAQQMRDKSLELARMAKAEARRARRA